MSQKFKSELELQALNNATTDTDKFLVSDGGIVKYRTGSEMLSDLGVTLNTASKLQHQVKAGVAINKGQAVYVTSADGTNMIVGLASNASEATSSKTMGLLASTVSTNGFANVVAEGLLSGLNTVGATAGDPVWLGTSGNLIYGLLNKPYAPAHLVFIGIVTRVNANNGEIFVKVQNGFELNEIHDVDLKTTTPVNGHILGFDGTLWVNKTIAGWLGYTPANASGTTNYLSKFTGTTTLGNSQIYDNGTNVGIGTSSPSGKLDVIGNLYTSGEFRIGASYAATGTGLIKSNSGVLSLFTWGDSTNIQIGGSDVIFKPEAGSERMRLTSAGNLGVGTTSPATKLEVSGIASFTGSGGRSVVIEGQGAGRIDINGDGSAYAVGIKFNSSPGGTALSGIWNYGSGTSQQWLAIGGTAYNNAALYILPSGNVGIGTTSPSQKLEVSGIGYASSDFRAPIFYDANNTDYYVDLASTSDAAIKVRGGALHGPNPTWGKYLLVGGDGRQNYTNNADVASVCTTDGNLHIDAGSTKSLYLNYYDGDYILLGNGASSIVSSINNDGSHRPQIIYDYNNTGYYLNPDSTSNLNALNLAGDLSFGAQTGTWITSNAMTDSIGWNSSHGVYIGSNTLGYNSYIRGNGTFTNNTGTHNLLHADNYTTYTDPRLYRGVNAFTDFQSFVSTPGTVRFDQANSTGGFSNAPGGYTYGGVLSLRGDSFGMQLWGSHTGDFYFKTQWNNDQYSGWREVIHSANIGSQSVSYAASAGNADTLDGLHASSFLTSYSETDTLQTVTGRGNTTSNGLIATASESREVSTYLPSSYTTNDLVSGHNYKWYSDVWRLGTTRSGGMAAADFVIQFNGSNRLNLTTNGNLTALADMRAPIFYNTNNTGFYLDGDNSSSGGWRLGTPSGVIDFGPFNSYHAHIYTDRPNFYFNAALLINGANVLYENAWLNNKYFASGGEIYCTSIYDSDNGAYYLNPAGGSNLNTVSAINYTFTGASSGTPGLVTSTSAFKTLSSDGTTYGYGVSTNIAGGLDIMANQSGQPIRFWAGTTNISPVQRMIISNGDVTASDSFRSPIFYDSNNTSYYVDPTSTTQINNLRVSTLDSAISWTDNAYMLASPTAGFRFNDSASNINAMIIDNSGNTFAYSSHRAPIFYDSNNTGFYVNPAGTSSVSRVFYNNYLISQNSGGLMGDYNINNNAAKCIWTIGESWPLVNMYGLAYEYDGTYFHGISLKWDGVTYSRLGLGSHGSFFTGAVTSGTSFNAPIFYDSNNTVYYSDPAGTSNMNAGVFNGENKFRVNQGGYCGSLSSPALQVYSESNNSAYMSFHKNAIYAVNMGLDADNVLRIGGWSASAGRWELDMSGNNWVAGSSRAPIFYDYNDTSFYFDGSNTGDSIRCAGDIVAYYSDERLKDKKGNIENALEKVLSLNGFYYEPNEVAQSLGYKKRLEVGVSAQEVEAVLPELIKDAPIGKGYKTLDYGKLTPLLIEAVKEQQKQIEELKELVNKLINK